MSNLIFHANELGENILHRIMRASPCYSNPVETVTELSSLAQEEIARQYGTCMAKIRRTFSGWCGLSDEPSDRFWTEFLDRPNRDGQTPLHIAAAMGRLELVEILIQLGTRAFEILDRENRCPLIFAIRSGRLEMTRLILSHTPPQLLLQPIGTSIYTELSIHVAAKCGQADLIFDLVLLQPSTLNLPASGWWRKKHRLPISYAICQSNVETVIALVQLGATIPRFKLRKIHDIRTTHFLFSIGILPTYRNAPTLPLTEDEILAYRYRAYFELSLTWRLLLTIN